MILAHEFMEVAPPQLRRIVVQEVVINADGTHNTFSEVWSKDERHQLISVLKFAHPNMKVIGFDMAEYGVLRITVTEERKERVMKK